MKVRFVFLFILMSMGSMVFAQSLPDLRIGASALRSSIFQTHQSFTTSSCAYIEGCLNGTGRRKLLKFNTVLGNIGTADLILGDPAAHPELYEFSPCHNHYHLKAGTRYELLNAAGTVVVVGRKQAFCFRDSRKFQASAGPSNGYNCHSQGITRGWADVYLAKLDCQWIDITGLRAGTYTLRVTVNPERLLNESNYSNNRVSVSVNIQ